MRMRKKKWADPFLEAHADYALQNPIENKGHWHDILHCEILHVEIGMGKGKYLLNMSNMYPEEGWVGLEKDHSAAAVAARGMLADNENPVNRKVIVGAAEDMEQWFGAGEIDVIHLNFSDPWPKKKTHKKRLSSETFLKMYHALLSKDGIIRMKTDNIDLYEDSVLYFLNNGFTLTEMSVDYRRKEHPEDAVTEYESKFMAEGKPIYQLAAKPVVDYDVND